MRFRSFFGSAFVAACCAAAPLSALADEPSTKTDKAPADAAISPAELMAAAKAAAGAGAAASGQPQFPPYAEVIKDSTTVDGLFKLHQKENRLLAEISPAQLNRDYIVLISIAKGIGMQPLLGGMSWGFGDDWVWQFRKVGKNLHVVRRNVRFTAATGSPEERAVKLAYTDSVLFSLPIVTMAPTGAMVVDFTGMFMSDLPQISSVLQGFYFAPDKSTWAAVKGFPENIELQVAATYASGGNASIPTVADSRGVTVNVHYSISALPVNGYVPRLADDRIGYFTTVVKNYSTQPNEDPFVRYINRWDLQKSEPQAALSPPRKPIIFWLEKTVPYKYRKPIRDGILEWNKAYEKAGFVNAVEVRQQPDNEDWDPEDVRYNTFRWITAGAGFAMGPSRVNPLTGQILDADIIFDASFLDTWKNTYETFTPEAIAALTGGPLDLASYEKQLGSLPKHRLRSLFSQCEMSQGQSMQLALAASVNATRKQTPEELEKLIMQGLKHVSMHEVGHTLGLRHNFKASNLYTLEEMQDPAKTADTGLTASVMDYTPANLVPKDMKQGDFYSMTVGPYDMWAIEYGYKPVPGGSPEGERSALDKVAARSGETALAFSTDEDTRGIDPDPTSNRFDHGKDAVAYAKMQARLVGECWPDMVNRVVDDGKGYQKARQTFGVLLGSYFRAMFFASRYIGGLDISRSHKGDKDARPPFTVIDPKQQREALTLLEEHVFNDKPLEFPPELYNQLAASRWEDWGSSVGTRSDLPVHQLIAMWQDRFLDQLLSPLTLERLHDSELKVSADQEAFTAAELLEGLTKAIFVEVDTFKPGEYTTRKPAISSLRRNLQRNYLKRLSNLAMGNGDYPAPQDCQTIAYAELNSLQERIEKALKSDIKFDAYSRAHLQETASRIAKVADARLTLTAP